MNVIFCTTCRGRVEHIRETLPRNLADNPDAMFLLLGYGDEELAAYIRQYHAVEITEGRLVFYQFATDRFEMSKAKNMAARCAMLENADVIVTLDADNFAGRDFTAFIEAKMARGVFLCPDFPRIKSLPHGPNRPQRGYAGRLVIRCQEFLNVGGYNETFDTWRGEDIDLIARMQATGYEMRFIDNHYLDAIPHSAEVRFKEYPHAQAYETKGEWKKICATKDTVVNYGNIGCGTVYRNFEDQPIEIKPVPTRVFGIGLHKTATSSLHEAFKLLGFDSFHWETNRKAFRIWNEMLAGKSTLLEQSYALCDLPIPMLYQKLDATYPNSKFILTIRDEADWLKSVEALWNPAINPHYDWDDQPFSHKLHEALYGCTYFHADTFLARYRRHNAEVLAYFRHRPDDLLVMDMSGGAGWRELCAFLSQPVPDVEYPVSFKTKH